MVTIQAYSSALLMHILKLPWFLQSLFKPLQQHQRKVVPRIKITVMMGYAGVRLPRLPTHFLLFQVLRDVYDMQQHLKVNEVRGLIKQG